MRRGSVSFAGALNGPETEAVGLGTAGENDALNWHIACGESVERIFQHSGVGFDRFSHRGFFDIGSKNQIGYLIKRRKGTLRTLTVHQTDPDVRGADCAR